MLSTAGDGKMRDRKGVDRGPLSDGLSSVNVVRIQSTSVIPLIWLGSVRNGRKNQPEDIIFIIRSRNNDYLLGHTTFEQVSGLYYAAMHCDKKGGRQNMKSPTLFQ